ncbi:MAG: hypothetical protein HY563_07665 [Ignavibacteriales bacterium]|nr:hypothetical protein [Ignavibacteriales bacterium]
MNLLHRPPRRKKSPAFQFVSLLVALSACAPTIAQREASLRSIIEENLFSTEHLAFGADPRSVSAVRSQTKENDIPLLIRLLSDPNPSIVRVSQYVIVSYNSVAIPYLTGALSGSTGTNPLIRETIGMIEKRKTP